MHAHGSYVFCLIIGGILLYIMIVGCGMALINRHFRKLRRDDATRDADNYMRDGLRDARREGYL